MIAEDYTAYRKEFIYLLREQETNLTKEFWWIFRKQTKVKKVERVDEKVRRYVEYINDFYWSAEFVYEQDGMWYLFNHGSGGA